MKRKIAIITSITILLIIIILIFIFDNKNPYKFNSDTIGKTISENIHNKLLNTNKVSIHGNVISFDNSSLFLGENVKEFIEFDESKNITQITKTFRIYNIKEYKDVGTFCEDKEKCRKRVEKFTQKAMSNAKNQFGTSYETVTNYGLTMYVWTLNNNVQYVISIAEEGFEDDSKDYYCNLNCSYSLISE